MDEQLEEVFNWAKRNLIHLYYRWIMYVQMFGDNSHRINLINETASNLLMEFQWLVIDNMILGLSKFTDPAKVQGNLNLSFPLLISEIEKTEKAEIVGKLRKILTELDAAVENFREIRNKRIAHNDLVVSLDSENSPLPGVSRQDVNVALQLASDFLNKIESIFNDNTTLYDMTILPYNNDGRSVLIRLQKSLAYEKLANEGKIDGNQWRELGNIDEQNAN